MSACMSNIYVYRYIVIGRRMHCEVCQAKLQCNILYTHTHVTNDQDIYMFNLLCKEPNSRLLRTWLVSELLHRYIAVHKVI